jgi:hypothetical protein
MRTRARVAGVLALGLLTSAAWGAAFSASTKGVSGQVGGVAEGGGCGSTFLSRSTSQTIVALNSISCNAGGLHTDNRYFRAYDMAGYPDGFDVCEVQVGIESAAAGVPGIGAGVTQPVTVNVYSNSDAAFPAGTLTLVGTAAVEVADQALTVLAVPLAASVPAGALEMVLEVFTPNGQAAGHSFFIGSNGLGESAPSYLQASDCGASVPTSTGDLGFANMQIVLNASGDPQTGGPPIVEIPTLGTWGVAWLAVALAGAAFLVLRKRTAA